MNQTHQKQAPMQLFSEVKIHYKSGHTETYVHVVFQMNGPLMVLEQPRGDRRSYLINFSEVLYCAMLPAKVELA